MNYQIDPDRVDRIAAHLRDLIGIQTYLAYAGHSHTSMHVSKYWLKIDIYCHSLAELWAVQCVAKKTIKEDFKREIVRLSTDNSEKFYCITYSKYLEQ